MYKMYILGSTHYCMLLLDLMTVLFGSIAHFSEKESFLDSIDPHFV